ncbi:hypothetical protein BS50DRAFT_397885 [Corynespora cassiicola Philippines]|uniref:C3H1-type domain-containing protein n=1 Tax=Corynespora cassiicola Philippines TaxID=1448308 RepID=A0A2T2NL62_CORCC|nr:hypothetical protein BS50DRAFT_397885 [Corynespora cassiicola Philippines]
MNAPAYSPSPVSAKLATTMASPLNFRTQATMNMNMASPVNLTAHAPMEISNSSPLSMSTPSPFNTTAPLTHVPSPPPFRMTTPSPMMNAATPMSIMASSPVMTTASPAMPFASSPQLPIFQRAQTPYNLPTNNQSPVFRQSPAMTLSHGPIAPEDILRSAGTPPQRGPAAKMIACLNCHLNWWNEDCDCGEPCANCKILGVDCERPPCANFQAGECKSKGRCTRAHEGDGYANLACFRRDLKRKGKMSDQHEISPCRREMGGPQQ